MNVPVKLGVFALVLVGTFSAGVALGAAVPEIASHDARVTIVHRTGNSHATDEDVLAP